MWQPRKILVIRFSAIGDVVLTTPLLRMLKSRYPESEIDFLVKSRYAELIESHPSISRVWEFDPHAKPGGLIRDLRNQRYDAVADLQSNFRSGWFVSRIPAGRKVRFFPERLKRFLLVRFHLDRYTPDESVPLRYLRALEPWGVKDDGKGAELCPSPEAESSLNKKLKGMVSSAPILLLAPGAGRATKRWLPDRFGEVGRHFSERNHQVILIGGDQDRAVCHEVGHCIPDLKADLSGSLSLQESIALIQKARMLVTNDTGVMHIATAVQTPVVALFGPTTRQLGFYPFRAPSAVIEKALDCRPCSYHGSARCPKGHFHCMRRIQSDEVIAAAEQLMKKASK
jgi:lipopolysaccharide heptosyltransferase II